MNSREAFEAQDRARYEIDAALYRHDHMGRYRDRPIQCRWETWQAAIQHASDVATAKCAEISEREHRDFKGLNPDAPPGKRGNSYVEGLSDGADLAGDAIKEALK